MIRSAQIAALVGVISVSAVAGPLDQGNIAVVQDINSLIHGTGDTGGGFQEPLQSKFCKETAKAFFTTHPDQFDGLVTFTPRQLSMFENVQQGTPVRSTATGIGRDNAWNLTAQYGSAGKLSQCVFMASLGQLPSSPDSYVPGPFGLPFGLTGVELVGHEYGHHWLMAANFDKGNGQGAWDLLRGYESGAPNQHYSAYTDSHSVMYGSWVTDNGNGSFTLRGGDRKYGELDQYLMGLRAPNEVSPIMTIDEDGSRHGSPAVAMQKSSTLNVTGTRVDVTIQDVIRANGQRSPDHTTAQKCWRVAFVLVTEGSNVPAAQDVAKVEAYRARFTSWFTWATDGRGTMDTRLSGNGCTSNPPVSTDGGTVKTDAGTTTPRTDAGTNDAGTTTGGEIPGGSGGGDGTAAGGGDGQDPGPAYNKDNIDKLRPTGCGCGAAPGVLGFLAIAGALLRRRRGH